MHEPLQRRQSLTGRSVLLEVFQARVRAESEDACSPPLVIMQGIIFAHLVLLVFFCVKAVSSPSYLRPTPRSAVTTASDMRISTYNLRYDSMPDNITVAETLSSLPDPLTPPTYYGAKGEQPWSTRRVKVYQHLNSAGVVLAGKSFAIARVTTLLNIQCHRAGFQEALVRQVDDLATLFGNEWAWVRYRPRITVPGDFNSCRPGWCRP